MVMPLASTNAPSAAWPLFSSRSSSTIHFHIGISQHCHLAPSSTNQFTRKCRTIYLTNSIRTEFSSSSSSTTTTTNQCIQSASHSNPSATRCKATWSGVKYRAICWRLSNKVRWLDSLRTVDHQRLT